MKKLIYIFLFLPTFCSSQVLIDSFIYSNWAAPIYTGANTARGQSFICNGTYTLDSCFFYCDKIGSPTGNVYASLFAHTGTFGTDSKPTGSALVTSIALPASNFTTSASWMKFTFPDNFVMSTGYYVLTISYISGNSSNYIRVYSETTNTTHAGNRCYYDSSSIWVSASSETAFYVYGRGQNIFMGTNF